jgi:hypothetical protein
MTPPAAQRRTFRRLHAQQQFLPLLILTIMLMLLVIVATSYVAARASALSNAEAAARTNAQIAREVVSERGQFPAIANNQLVASSGASNYVLVNDTWVVDHVRQLTGEQAVIYQLIATATNSSSFQAVASNMHRLDAQGHPIPNARATGDPMPATAQSAIFGACGQVADNTACYGDFSGEVTIAGVNYVASFEPLLDQSGRLVGAVGVLTSQDDVLAPSKQLAIMLLLMGLLVGLVALVTGTWLASRSPDRLLGQLDSQLDVLAGATSELGRLARQQQFRLQRQQRTARQVGAHARTLETLAAEMDSGQTALQQTTTAIWAEMSQPGIATNATAALRLAREAAIRASEVGTTGEETRTHARQVIALMNQVIAEGRALAKEGQEAESHANELVAALDRMETGLGEQLLPRRYDLGSTPLVRRLTDASQRIRELFQPNDHTPSRPRRPTASRPMHGRSGPMSTTRARISGLPPHGGSGRSPSTSFRGNELWHGLSMGDERGFPPAANPNASGSRRGGHRPSGDQAPPRGGGGLPPLNWFDDGHPPSGSSDSRWLTD